MGMSKTYKIFKNNKQIANGNLIKDKDKEVFTVWVGGIEVVSFYITFEEAEKVALSYAEEGYDDVIIEHLEGICTGI
jgi:hypothetical protein